jgi:hypothetical protein
VRAGGLALPGPNLTITDGGAALTAGAGCEQIDGNTARCLESDEGPARPLMMRTGDRGDRVLYDDFRSRTVSIRGGGGSDTLHGGSSEGGPVEVLGDAGDDHVTIALNFGSGGVVRGGAGDDVVRAFESAGDQLFGDDGDDHLIHSACDGASALDGGTGNDTYTFDSPFPECSPPVIGGIVPGPGFDTLDQSPERFAALAFNFSDCPACVEAVLGTSFDDEISGDNNPRSSAAGTATISSTAAEATTCSPDRAATTPSPPATAGPTSSPAVGEPTASRPTRGTWWPGTASPLRGPEPDAVGQLPTSPRRRRARARASSSCCGRPAAAAARRLRAPRAPPRGG